MPELGQTGFEVLRVAVREARDRQIKSLNMLREHLGLLFPGRSVDIEQAIAYWSAQVRRNGINS